MVGHGTTDLKRTSHGRFWVAKEDECDAISGGKSQKLVVVLRSLKLSRVTDKRLEFPRKASLLLHGHSGIRHDVHKEDMGNFQLGVAFAKGRARHREERRSS